MEILENFTKSVISAIDSDVGQIGQRLKFSLWINAISTAGLGTIVVRAESIIRPFPFGAGVATATLFCSLIISAQIFRQFNNYFSLGHMQQTQFLIQRNVIMVEDVGAQLSARAFSQSIKSVGFLPSFTRLQHRLADHLTDRIRESRLIEWQQWLVLTGFAVILELTFLRQLLV